MGVFFCGEIISLAPAVIAAHCRHFQPVFPSFCLFLPSLSPLLSRGARGAEKGVAVIVIGSEAKQSEAQRSSSKC
jgi:hypothetical protein